MLKQDWKYNNKHTEPKPGQLKSNKLGDRPMKVETQDFYFSVYLRLNGITMDEMKEYGSRKMFVFEDNEQYQELKRAYYWNKGLVDPLLFKKGIRELKSLMFNT